MPDLVPGPAPLDAPPAEGVKQVVRLKIAQAVRALTDALGAMGEVGSDEARAVLRALQTLAPVTPEVDEGVTQSDILAAIARAMPPPPPVGPFGVAPPMPRPIAPTSAIGFRSPGLPFGPPA